MPIMNLRQIKTRDEVQKDFFRRQEEVKRLAVELLELMQIPLIRDLMGIVELAKFQDMNWMPDGANSFFWSSLLLTNEGLREVKSYLILGESYTIMEGPCKIVELYEYERVVYRYHLTVEDVEALKEKLQG